MLNFKSWETLYVTFTERYFSFLQLCPFIQFSFPLPHPLADDRAQGKKGRETRRGYIRRFKNLRDSHSI